MPEYLIIATISGKKCDYLYECLEQTYLNGSDSASWHWTSNHADSKLIESINLDVMSIGIKISAFIWKNKVT
jgi:hypothetical protein